MAAKLGRDLSKTLYQRRGDATPPEFRMNAQAEKTQTVTVDPVLNRADDMSIQQSDRALELCRDRGSPFVGSSCRPVYFPKICCRQVVNQSSFGLVLWSRFAHR